MHAQLIEKGENPWKVYLVYWSAYVVLFAVVQGLPSNAVLVSLYNELLGLVPRIIFVWIVVERLMDRFLFNGKWGGFLLFYVGLIVVFASVQRLIDNFIILKYFLPHWQGEPVFSVAPFLYSIIKLQFLVTLPFSFKLFRFWTIERDRVQQTQAGKLKAEQEVLHYRAQAEVRPAGEEYDFILVRCDRQMVRINTNDILYLEAQRNTVLIYTRSEVYKTHQTISEMIEKLPGDKFVRVHRSFIVSLSKVEGFKHNAVSIGAQVIPLGRLYKKAITELHR